MNHTLFTRCAKSLMLSMVALLGFALFANLFFVRAMERPSSQELLARLTLDEKIGQLFMVAAVSSEEGNEQFIQESPYRMDTEYVDELIEKYKVGGIIFLGAGHIEKQKEKQKHFNHVNSTHVLPLWYGQDFEWGLSMRLKDAVRFPRNMTLGALCDEDEHLVYELGSEIARECRCLGVQVSFAPVVDINNNPSNPVINNRSFGEDKDLVARRARLYMKGLQDGGVIACAKHFPGHGDTDVDSHEDLPLLNHSRARLDALELTSFRDQIASGVKAIMIGHLEVPALEEEKRPTSLSSSVVTDLLREELGFEGLIFTDGLGMKALTKKYVEGEIEVEALLAGNDVLLCPLSVPEAVKRIKEKLNQNLLTEPDLDRHVLKVLEAKRNLRFDDEVESHDVYETVHNENAYNLKNALYSSAVTLVKNENQLPLKSDQLQVLQIGGNVQGIKNIVKKHGISRLYSLPSKPSKDELVQLKDSLLTDKPLLITLFGMNKFLGQQFGIADETLALIKDLNAKNLKITVCLFGSPYSLRYFGDEAAIVVVYEDDYAAQEAAIETIIGKRMFRGALPVTASEQFPVGLGLSTR